jgi:hypothetical protein
MPILPDQLQALDAATLTPILRSASGSPTVEAGQWSYHRLYGSGITQGIFRFAGIGQDGGRSLPWSLILKVLAPSGGNPGDSEREASAYQSNVLGNLRAGLVAPRCYAAIQQADGGWWLWLEEVVDALGHQWPVEHYGRVARHLGQFNGAYLNDVETLAWRWLSHGWLQDQLAPNAAVMGRLAEAMDTPLGRQALPPDTIAGLEQLWAEREIFLQTLERLPQTLCHRDAHRRNLFTRATAESHLQTVAIDWSYTGPGAPGEEITALTLAALLFFDLDISQAHELDETVFAGYLAGLEDAGWRGDPRQVRFAYAATAALRYGVGYLARFVSTFRDYPAERMAQALGRPISGPDFADSYALKTRFLLSLADEARALRRRIDP